MTGRMNETRANLQTRGSLAPQSSVRLLQTFHRLVPLSLLVLLVMTSTTTTTTTTMTTNRSTGTSMTATCVQAFTPTLLSIRTTLTSTSIRHQQPWQESQHERHQHRQQSNHQFILSLASSNSESTESSSDDDDNDGNPSDNDVEVDGSTAQPPSSTTETTATVSADAGSNPFLSVVRGKVNEIDFCIAPADASLSRAYQSKDTMTRFLNNASNRAVRRILLSKSWPSPEALNQSLRQVLLRASSPALSNGNDTDGETSPSQPSQSPLQSEQDEDENDVDDGNSDDESASDGENNNNKRFGILGAIFRQTEKAKENEEKNIPSPQPPSPLRSNDQYVADQLKNFADLYGGEPGFSQAEAYLACILSLATSGNESPRVKEVLEDGVYDESYQRVLSVLKTGGVVLERSAADGPLRIADSLIDQDICWSMVDKIQLGKETKDPTKSDDTDTGSTIDSPESGVLLRNKEPTMTRQLNILSNIVLRAMLFGGDQELLVLSETLVADKDVFVQQWYANKSQSSSAAAIPDNEERPGVQYLDCLIAILQRCYEEGAVQGLIDPPLPLTRSYANAYERLVATLLELGSGYIQASDPEMPIPRTAQEELGRFAMWESAFRQKQADIPALPQDLEGNWEVQEEIAGEAIGVSTLTLQADGMVRVAPPLRGLTWKLDPGPTHLDTCTFQVLAEEDGTVLQYRGFIDRGARLEARFSGRPLRIRGSVVFRMRSESNNRQDGNVLQLPINYQTGTTKFVMTKLR